MKKITSLMTLLLMFVCGNIFAQDIDLEKNAITIGAEVAEGELTPNTWYLMYQRRGSDGYAHYENAETRLYKRAASFSGDPLTDGMKASNAANWLVRFIKTEKDGEYNIQFANGALWQTTGTADGSAIMPTTNKYDDGLGWAIAYIGEDAASKPVWSFTSTLTNKPLDNNGNGNTLSMWGSGACTDVNGNAAWSIVNVTFTELNERDAALSELKTIFATYGEYKGKFEPGTEPGQYDPACVEAFEAALDAASVVDGPDAETLTAEDLLKLAQDIKDTYDAMIATRVPFAAEITPGYYFIRSGLGFNETVTTEEEEDPETGEMIPGETITTYFKKAMYANGTNLSWNTLDASNVAYLWKIEATDSVKVYSLTNCAKNLHINTIAQSEAVTLTTTDTGVVFDVAGLTAESDNFSDTPVTYYNIRLVNGKERGYQYAHCGAHGGGSGKSGNIVGWCNTVEEGVAHATEWALEPVDEATVDALLNGPARAIAEMADSIATIKETFPGQKTIAEDVITKIDEENPAIISAEQLSSPYTETNEGSIEEAIDGKTNTFWHSSWSGGATEPGIHYLQVEVSDLTTIAYVITRRPVDNDHFTTMAVYGTNISDAEKSECTLLNTSDYPFKNNTEVLTSPVFDATGYQYLRFYAEKTTNNRGYWHLSEIQIYPATSGTPHEKTQAGERSTEIAAVEAAIEAWNALNLEEADLETVTAAYNKVNEAWAAWTAVYVNPDALRQAIENTPSTSSIVIGDNPGQWSDASAANTITSLVEAAKAYDADATYTPAQSEKYISDLASAQENMLTSANKVKTGVWYNIRFATEAEYEANGWDKNGAQASENEELGVTLSEELFGKYVTAANSTTETTTYTTTDGEEAKYTQFYVEPMTDEDPTFNASLCFDAKDDIEDADCAKFQFVAVGDTAYVIQNKATGLYIRANGTSGRTRLSIHPTLFNASAIGYGQNIIHGITLDGANQNNLHAQRDGNLLVTWEVATPGTNSGLFIEEVEAVADYTAPEFTMNIWPGEVQVMCYPTSVEAKEGQFYLASIEGTTVTLNPIQGNKANPGQAVVYIKGSVEDYQELVDDPEDPDYNGDAYELTKFAHGTRFVVAADTTATLRGTFVNQTIGTGNLWAEGNTFALTKKSNNTVGANTGYIAANIENLDQEITLVISTEEVDAIEAVATVNKIGGIYTIDGKFIGNGNLNTLKTMPKGIYVVNGIKVAVK